MQAGGQLRPREFQRDALGGAKLGECPVLPANTVALKAEVRESQELKPGQKQ